MWARFNQSTRCVKGLFSYESCFRWYVGEIIDRMVEEKVMYAELRPMMLDKYMPSDDGSRKIGLVEQMSIISEEIARKRSEMEWRGSSDDLPFGLKIIYCTPRSVSKTTLASELQDCLMLKRKFPDLICGNTITTSLSPHHRPFGVSL